MEHSFLLDMNDIFCKFDARDDELIEKTPFSRKTPQMVALEGKVMDRRLDSLSKIFLRRRPGGPSFFLPLSGHGKEIPDVRKILHIKERKCRRSTKVSPCRWCQAIHPA